MAILSFTVIYGGVHYPIDVVVGIVIAVIIAVVTVFLTDKIIS